MDPSQFKRSVAEAFDEASEGYDDAALGFFDRGADALVGSLDLRGHEKALDAATGTGKIALRLASRLPRGEVLGIDFSKGMIERARDKSGEAKLRNVGFLQADLDATHLEPMTFDVITCGFGVHFWSDMAATLGRLTASLKRGGLLAISCFARGAFEPQSTSTLARFSRYGVRLPSAYTWERLDSPEKNRWLMDKAGMTGFSCRAFEAGYRLQSPEAWWSLVRYTGFRAFLNQLPADQVERFREEEVVEIAQKGSAGLRLNVPILIVHARKP